MAKAGEIPPKDHPQAAPRASIDDAIKRADHLGYKWIDAVKKAGLARNTAFTLKRGTGSIGSLRKVEEWLVKEEAKRGPRAKDEGAGGDEWAQLGHDLQRLDRRRYEFMLQGLREIVKAKKKEADALSLMFRANPDAEE